METDKKIEIDMYGRLWDRYMIPQTLDELFDQIQIDADNGVVYNRDIYCEQAKKIVDKLVAKKSTAYKLAVKSRHKIKEGFMKILEISRVIGCCDEIIEVLDALGTAHKGKWPAMLRKSYENAIRAAKLLKDNASVDVRVKAQNRVMPKFCPYHKSGAQCIWGIRGCCKDCLPCEVRLELRQ